MEFSRHHPLVVIVFTLRIWLLECESVAGHRDTMDFPMLDLNEPSASICSGGFKGQQP